VRRARAVCAPVLADARARPRSRPCGGRARVRTPRAEGAVSTTEEIVVFFCLLTC
jgi:hypothetical protein